MYTSTNGKAKTMNGHRISNGESMVNEELRRRMSAPIALPKKKKRVGSLKDRSMSSIRKCIRAANKPYSLSKPCSISKTSSSLSTAIMSSSIVRLNANVNQTACRVEPWPYAQVAYINGLKMVIRRSTSSYSSSPGKMLK